MGEGIFGFELPGGGGFGPSGLGGFGLPDPFQAASGRTAIRCDLTDRDIANTAQAAGIPGLLNLAQVLARYGGLDGACNPRGKIAAAGLALGGGMGFLDALNGIGTTIGNVVTGVINSLPTVVQATQTVVGAINTIQDTINGNTTQASVMGMPMQPMTTSMVNGNTGGSGQAAFEAACRADPACTAAVVAALQSGMPMNGAMMNGSGMMDMVDAQLAALGFPPAVIQAVKAVPGLVSRLLPAAAGTVGGIALATGVNALTTMGGMMRLPRRIQVPDGKGGVREYVSRGRPVLYSGDLSAVNRVRKVGKRIPRPRRSRRQPPILIGGNGQHSVCGKCLTSPCGCGGR